MLLLVSCSEKELPFWRQRERFKEKTVSRPGRFARMNQFPIDVDEALKGISVRSIRRQRRRTNNDFIRNRVNPRPCQSEELQLQSVQDEVGAQLYNRSGGGQL